MCYPAGQMRFMVQDAQLEHALPKETALALASAAEKIGFDLLLFGEGSGDIYAQQVGLLTGELLKLSRHQRSKPYSTRRRQNHR